jgi:hypothetical protein
MANAEPRGSAPILLNSVDNSVDIPADIITELRVKEPNVDLNLLPEVVRRYASELSSSIGADPLGSAFAMIVAASGLAIPIPFAETLMLPQVVLISPSPLKLIPPVLLHSKNLE